LADTAIGESQRNRTEAERAQRSDAQAAAANAQMNAADANARADAAQQNAADANARAQSAEESAAASAAAADAARNAPPTTTVTVQKDVHSTSSAARPVRRKV